MTEQQSALTRLLDWTAGQVAVMRASYSADEDGRIYDEEIREEVEQVEADMAALNGLEERIRKLECDLGSALVRAESAEQKLAEVREENRGLRQDTLILERRGDRFKEALDSAHSILCQLSWLDPVPGDRDEEELQRMRRHASQWVRGNNNRSKELSAEGSGGGPDHSRDFEGSDPRGMGPLPGEPGNPNPSFEQMENNTLPTLEAVIPDDIASIIDTAKMSTDKKLELRAYIRTLMKREYQHCRESTQWHLLVNDIERAAGFDSVAVTPDATSIVERVDEMRRTLSEPAVLGNCMYCDKPVRLGEQAEQHFSHATCDRQERESVKAMEGEKMQPCWGDFMQRIYQLGITDPSEIAKAGEPAAPSVPEAVRRLPDEWRAALNHPLPYGPGRALADCADQLERALSQNGEPNDCCGQFLARFLDRDHDVMSNPDADPPDGWPDEWDEKPFARVRWAEDRGDPQVGLQGWTGFCFTQDQSGTVLADLIAKHGESAIGYIGTLNWLSHRQWEWVERMGWHNKTPLEYMALIGSEVGEATNECRGEVPSELLGEELADIILRVGDMAVHFGIDLEDEIARKRAVNEQRGTRGRAK